MDIQDYILQSDAERRSLLSKLEMGNFFFHWILQIFQIIVRLQCDFNNSYYYQDD